MAKHKKYARRSDEQKRAIIAAYAETDMTLRAFCKKHAISTALLYSWRDKFSAEDDMPKPPVANGAFTPASDTDLMLSAMKTAKSAAEDLGMSPERFTAEAIRFALSQMGN